MELNKDIYKNQWHNILGKYSIIKEVYIEAEETNPGLLTNLQPLNEFRAALDHIMKMMDAIYNEENEQEYYRQIDKLHSHLNRAFYDISDYACINYRNQIVSLLEKYNNDVIRLIIPEYYPKYRVEIERISQRIAKYRHEKGKGQIDDIDRFDEYKNDFYELKNIYLHLLSKSEDLESAGTVLHKRDEILLISKRYDPDIITKVFPNYFSQWVIKLKNFKFDGEDVEKNIEYVNQIFDEVLNKEPILVKLSEKSKTKSVKGNIIGFIIGFFSGLLSSLAVTFFTKDD